MPERAGWWLAALVVVAVVVPSWASVPVVVFVLATVGWNRWRVQCIGRQVEVSCTVPPWADHGQRVEAVLEIRNRSRYTLPWAEVDLPCALGLGRSEPHREALRLEARGTIRRIVPLRGLRRGHRSVSPPRLAGGDELGVARCTVTGPPAAVTVFPRVVPLERLGLPAQSPFVQVPAGRSLLVDPTAVVGVREYRPGDPFAGIHWTATARTGDLMVKQYERAEARDTLVCLDLASDGYPGRGRAEAVELAVTVAASVLHHSILELQLPAGLLAPGGPDAGTPVVRLPPRAEVAHLRTMLEHLALADHGDRVSLAELLATLTHLLTGTTVLAVTGTLTARAASHLLRAWWRASRCEPTTRGRPRTSAGRSPCGRSSTGCSPPAPAWAGRTRRRGRRAGALDGDPATGATGGAARLRARCARPAQAGEDPDRAICSDTPRR